MSPLLHRIGGQWFDISKPRVGRTATASAAYSATPPTVDPTILPTGPDYVRWEDLYVAVNDLKADGTIDVGAVLARCPTGGKTVTIGTTKNMTPSGTLMCSDFNSGYQAGISIPAWVRGLRGSGAGLLGSTSTGTVLTMKAGSSTKGNGARDSSGKLYVPVQDNNTPTQLNVLKHLSPQYPTVLQNLQVAGTEQGHVFSGVQVYASPDAVNLSGLLITGWDGDNGAPPGETSALAVNGVGPHLVEHVEVDGRRAPGGMVFGAMGMTFQNSVRAKFRFCNVHHTRVAAFVLYQSFYCELEDCTFDATYTPDDRPAIGNGAMNLERAAASKLTRCTLIGRQRRLHTTLSGDAGYTLNQAGVSYNYGDVVARDGSLTVVDPTFNDLWGNNRFMVQSWVPYLGSSVMGDIALAPKIITSAGARIPTNWISDVTYEQTAAAAWHKQ